MKTHCVRLVQTIVLLAIATAGCAGTDNGSPGDGDDMVSQLESELAISREPAPDDTRVKATGGNYAELARKQYVCGGGPCTCYIDGIQTSCSLVAACLRAHFCVLVRYAG